MTTTQAPTRLPKPLYAVAGAGEIAYRRLRTLPERVEALREQLTPRVRTLREQLPGRVEALRAEVPAKVTTLGAGAREVYGDLVARGEKVVDAARARRTDGPAGTLAAADEATATDTVATTDATLTTDATATTDTAAATKAVATKAVRKAVKKTAPKA
jgi:hypothetical protein